MFAARNMMFAGAFSPLSLSPALWLDGSDASTLYDATTGGSLVAADGAVARWEDKSGNARHATQGSLASRPLRKTAIQNGLDVVRFDGFNDFLSANSLSIIFNGNDAPFTVFSALSSSNTASLKAFFSSGNSISLNYFNWLGQDADEITRADRRAFGTDEKNAFGGSAWTAATMVSYVCSGATIDIYKDGSAAAAGADFNVGTFGSNSDRCSIGCLDRTSQALFWPGDISEIIVIPRAVTESERIAVESYLKNKWATP